MPIGQRRTKPILHSVGKKEETVIDEKKAKTELDQSTQQHRNRNRSIAASNKVAQETKETLTTLDDSIGGTARTPNIVERLAFVLETHAHMNTEVHRCGTTKHLLVAAHLIRSVVTEEQIRKAIKEVGL